MRKDYWVLKIDKLGATVALGFLVIAIIFFVLATIHW